MLIPKIMRFLLIISISSALIACSHVAGNIVPDKGPTMESIYDDLGEEGRKIHSVDPVFLSPATSVGDASQRERSSQPQGSIPAASPIFDVLPNPELMIYIFPHLAGTEGLPIPGYWTVFSAYPRTLYALPLYVKNPEIRK